MTDLTVVAKVTRPLIGGGDLDINDHDKYVLAGSSTMSGSVNWERQQVSAPWVDGDFTIARRRGNTTENISVYVSGTDQADLNTNIGTLIGAFTQDRYTLMITIGTQQHAWDCEAADYTVEMDTPHFVAKYVVVKFAIQRKPVALSGAW
jgi:hypothetical protein